MRANPSRSLGGKRKKGHQIIEGEIDGHQNSIRRRDANSWPQAGSAAVKIGGNSWGKHGETANGKKDPERKGRIWGAGARQPVCHLFHSVPETVPLRRGEKKGL